MNKAQPSLIGCEAAATLLESLTELVIQAGEAILAVNRSAMSVTGKSDGSPVTEADLAADHIIVEGLTRLTPHVSLLSEERVHLATPPYKDSFFLIDPLDGTKEFVKRNGEFTVNIALIEGHGPVLGVVHAPVPGLTYGAARGAGAFRFDGDARAPIRTRPLPATPTFLVSRSHKDPALAALLARAPKHEAIGRGSSLKFCLIAEGSADFYPRLGPTSEWDTAAGQCIVEQAGGAVWRLPELTPLGCNEKDSVLNPSFAVLGDPAYDWTKILHG